MFITGRTQMLSQFSLSDCLNQMKELGFDGVEISMLNKKFDFRPDLLEPYVIDYNRNLLSELDLKPGSVSCHGDYIYNDEVFENIKKTIPKVKSYGTDLFICSGTAKVTADSEEWNRMLGRMKEIVALAEHFGVTVALEAEPGFVVGNSAELLRLFSEIPSDSLCSNLDLGHAFLCEEHPLESIRQLGKKIKHVHVDNMSRGVHNHLLPQLGDMDLNEYISALSSVGFDGAMALDIYAYDYLKVAPDAVRYLNGLLKN